GLAGVDIRHRQHAARRQLAVLGDPALRRAADRGEVVVTGERNRHICLAKRSIAKTYRVDKTVVYGLASRQRVNVNAGSRNIASVAKPKFDFSIVDPDPISKQRLLPG